MMYGSAVGGVGNSRDVVSPDTIVRAHVYVNICVLVSEVMMAILYSIRLSRALL